MVIGHYPLIIEKTFSSPTNFSYLFYYHIEGKKENNPKVVAHSSRRKIIAVIRVKLC